MRILITGGAGFIGRAWCSRLAEAGHAVIVLDNFSRGPGRPFPPSVQVVKGDVRNVEDIEKAFSRGPFDRVDHLAALSDVRESAQKPEEYRSTNVEGTRLVLEACRKHGVPAFFFTSSSTVYGRADQMPTPETAPGRPISNYGLTKWEAEACAEEYARKHGLRVVVARLANIYGPGAESGVHVDLRRKVETGGDVLDIYGDGSQKKSYLDIESCLDAFEVLLTETGGRTPAGRKSPEAYNVGSRTQKTTREIADEVCRAAGRAPRYRFMGTGRGGWPGDVEEFLLDVSKLEGLGWRERGRGTDSKKESG